MGLKIFNFTTKTDEEYFVCFYEEELKRFFPPRFRKFTLIDIDEKVLREALKKWELELELTNQGMNKWFSDSEATVNRVIHKCYGFIIDLSDEASRCESFDSDSGNINIVKFFLMKVYRHQILKILYYINYYGSVQYKCDTDIMNVDLVFESVEASTWFINTLEYKYDIKNGKTYGFNAFVKALYDNEKVKSSILRSNCTQKKLILFINNFYGKTLIKNCSKMSNSETYKNEVSALVEQFLER